MLSVLTHQDFSRVMDELMIITAGHLISLCEVLDSLLLLRIVIFFKVVCSPFAKHPLAFNNYAQHTGKTPNVSIFPVGTWLGLFELYYSQQTEHIQQLHVT